MKPIIFLLSGTLMEAPHQMCYVMFPDNRVSLAQWYSVGAV